MGLQHLVALSLGLAAFLIAFHITNTLTRLDTFSSSLSHQQHLQLARTGRRGGKDAVAVAGISARSVVSSVPASEIPEPHLWKEYVSPPPPPPMSPALLSGSGSTFEWADEPASCHEEPGTEFDGQHVVHWGDNHLKDTAGECCQACKDEAEECWLKHQTFFNPGSVAGNRNKDVPWTSGSVYTLAMKAEYDRKVQEQNHQEQEYLDRLRMDLSRPMVYLDIAIKGKLIGRVTIVLFNKEAPRAAENYRALITGEKGVAPRGHEGAGKPYHLKGAAFYRIIDRFIIQTGANTDSVFGGTFKDDAGGLRLKHEHKGLLSMANQGPDTNTAHMSIMVNSAPHLDGKYTIFGQVVEGMDVVEAVNRLALGQPDNTANASAGAVILDCGQIRQGTPFSMALAASQ